MKLRRIEIENFRGFTPPIEIEVDDFTALIGKNDIGKSSVLAALTIFLEGEGGKIDPDDGCIVGDKSNVQITCEFDELPEKVILDDQFETTLEEEKLLLANGRLRITKVYDCSKSTVKPPKIFIKAENHPLDADGNSLLPLTIADLKKKAQQAGVQLEVGEATVKAKIRRAIALRSTTPIYGDVEVPIDKNESDTLWNQLLKCLPMCALFVSDRASSDKDKEAQSPMTVAVEFALSEVQVQLDELAKHVEDRVNDVTNRTLLKLRDMNEELADSLTASLRDKPKWKELFKYTLLSNQGIPLDKRGSGVRRMVLLSFFRAEAERRANQGGRPVIYAIEEPETAQHPDHQRMLVTALKEIASNGGQVIITTHAPSLAGEMSTDSLRFIDTDANKVRIVRSAKTEEPHALFTTIAERLGLLPDNHVRVLICVEGKNDIRFLRSISKTLNSVDNTLPDLSTDPRFVFVPMNGGNLIDVVNLDLFKNFHKPEFHVYDKDENGTYQPQITEIKNRNDRSEAIETKKRYMESYIHPDAIQRVKGVNVTINDTDDYTNTLASTLSITKKQVKATLAKEVAENMTVQEIDARDGSGEIRGWLTKLAEMANAS